MKRLLVIGLALGLTTGAAYAQDTLSGAEANVQITQQPQVVNISGSNATLKWQTNSTAANNVLYRQVGTSEWKHAFEAQGSKDHSVQLSGLQPSTKYEYQILTTSNKVRTAGQFDTPAAGAANFHALQRLVAALVDAHGNPAALHGARIPVLLKIAPDLDDAQMDAVAAALLGSGIDGLICTNTTIDRTGVAGSAHANENGGLSGKPLFEPSTEILRGMAQRLGGAIPLVGVGGVLTGSDAADKIEAGAKLVQIYSGLIYRGPWLLTECIEEIRRHSTESSMGAAR